MTSDLWLSVYMRKTGLQPTDWDTTRALCVCFRSTCRRLGRRKSPLRHWCSEQSQSHPENLYLGRKHTVLLQKDYFSHAQGWSLVFRNSKFCQLEMCVCVCVYITVTIFWNIIRQTIIFPGQRGVHVDHSRLIRWWIEHGQCCVLEKHTHTHTLMCTTKLTTNRMAKGFQSHLSSDRWRVDDGVVHVSVTVFIKYIMTSHSYLQPTQHNTHIREGMSDIRKDTDR